MTNLSDVLTAIGGERGAGDKPGIIGGEKYDAASDLLGSPRRPIGIVGRLLFSSTSFGTAWTIFFFASYAIIRDQRTCDCDLVKRPGIRSCE